MAVPHYAYLKIKMPRPKGVITVNRSIIRLDRCDREFHKISKTFRANQGLADVAFTYAQDPGT